MRVVAPNRNELVRSLFPRGGFVVEVGVQRGHFAAAIIEACRPMAFFGVDPWRWLPGEYEKDPDNRPTQVREREYQEAVARVGGLPGAALIRVLSGEAATLFADGSLHAVYLDADHTEPGVRGDLKRWWPKIKAGGVLAGHDFCVRDWIQVEPVVTEWAHHNGLDLMLSGEPDWPSWAVRKP